MEIFFVAWEEKRRYEAFLLQFANLRIPRVHAVIDDASLFQSIEGRACKSVLSWMAIRFPLLRKFSKHLSSCNVMQISISIKCYQMQQTMIMAKQ